MTTRRVAVIGVGNDFRRDDGVGPAVIRQLQQHELTGVSLTVVDGEPTQLLDAWAGMDLAIVIDAVLCEPSIPGRIHRTSIRAQLGSVGSSSTHGLGIPEALRLAEVLGRAPARFVVYAVEAADLGLGVGLSADVAGAVPGVTRAVLRELAEPDARPRDDQLTLGAFPHED
jgi:hydrogenase maturation protease